MSAFLTPATTAEAPPPAAAVLDFAPYATAGLRIFVLQRRISLSPEAFQHLIDGIRHEYEAHTNALLAARAGIDRARVFHQRMDAQMKAAEQCKPSCHKGCSGCCHCEVEITTDEADLLAHVVRDGLEIDRERLARQAHRARKSPAWVVPLSSESRCVFLGDDGACRVYDDRPAVCRRHMVSSPPESCVTLGAAISPIQVPRAEILLSAAIAVKGTNFTSLAKSLTARL